MKNGIRLVAAVGAVLASTAVGAAQYAGATYYRFSITGKYANGGPDGKNFQGNYQLSELALYDADGNRLTTSASLSPAAEIECAPAALLPGTYSITRPFYAENHGEWQDDPDANIGNLFDGDLYTKTEQHCFLSNWTSASEEIGWLRYNIRLTNGAPAVASFNIGTGDDSLTADYGTRQPVSWRLEASADGVNWQTIYNVVNSGYVVDGNYIPVYSNASWLNGGTPIPVTSQYDASKFALSREVAAGSGETLLVDPKYFNLTVKSRYNPGSAISDGVWGPDCFELTEIALYDAGGARQNLNLSLASAAPDAAITLLAPGEFSVTPKVESEDGNKRTYSYYTLAYEPDPNWSVERVFDGNPATGGFHNYAFCHYLKPPTWFTYKMRLADDAAPVRAYNLAAGNMDENKGARTPVNWALQGSLDGVYYAPFAEEFNSSYIPSSSRTWYNNGNPIATAPAAVPAYGIQYTVGSGGTLVLSRETVFDTVHTLGGAVSVPSGAAAVWDVATGDRLAIPGGGFAGAGEIVKAGGGTLEIGGANAFSGTVAVDGGTLAFANVSPSVDKKYFRFSLKKRYDGVPVSSYNQKPVEIGEIALYDASGVNVAQGLAFNTDSPEAPADEVPQGYFSITPNHASYQPATHNENPAKMFDGMVDTKGIYSCDLQNPETGELWYPDAAAWPDPDDESTWLRFNIHLADGANPVVAYNICSGNDTVNVPTRAPYSWRLEASADGIDWTIVDEMDDCPRFTTQNSTWFNGGRKFAVAWPSDVSSVPEAATFRVASGATLALPGSELSAFRIDCASRGTVRNLAMARGGSVHLENFAENVDVGMDGSATLPFAVADMSGDNATLSSVDIYIDGVKSDKYRLALHDGSLRIKNKVGLAIFFR